jgi:hypothetical protein
MHKKLTNESRVVLWLPETELLEFGFDSVIYVTNFDILSLKEGKVRHMNISFKNKAKICRLQLVFIGVNCID